MIYLDNAATSFPKPESVINTAVRVMRNVGGNAGRTSHQSAVKAGEIIYETRQLLADMFGCESEKVIFTLNCTQALNTAIRGSVRKGDHVIISSLEHNSVLRVVHNLSERGIISYSVAKAEPLSAEATLKNFEKLIKGETSLIVCSAVSNVFGTVLPVASIGELCRKKRLRFIVDGAQAAGYLEINMKKMNIDILCLPGHKGLFGLSGTGAMLLGEGVDVDPLIFGGTGSFSMSEHQPQIYPDKLESGTLNLPGIASLGRGIKFIERYGGTRAIHDKEKYLCDILTNDLANMKNIILYSDICGRNSGSVVPFNIKNMHSETAGGLISEAGFAVRTGYHCAYLAHKNYSTQQTGVIRVSPGIFNTKKEIKNLIFYLNKIALRQKL